MTYRLQDVFTAVADPNRRKILDYLAAGSLSAGELAEKFPISRPAVVRHLKVLEECDLVRIRRKGRYREHHLNPEPLMAIRTWIARYDKFWDQKLLALQLLVEDAARGEK